MRDDSQRLGLDGVDHDGRQAQQLFQHLLSNAIKYVGKPLGRVSLACALEQAPDSQTSQISRTSQTAQIAPLPMWHFTVAASGSSQNPVLAALFTSRCPPPPCKVRFELKPVDYAQFVRTMQVIRDSWSSSERAPQ
ncbi:hypothetical protein [Roseateles sp.]|uniref:hypothetical protein n=1 Tax=Roseateles sp. TaxID=1971397 RepID=UPI00286CCEE5|nr:hypothetical protein [Roseateles sp.]